MIRRLAAGAAILAAFAFSAPGNAKAADLVFSGIRFNVRPQAVGGPGPNLFDPRQVFVDEQGWLHLRFSRRDGKWRAAELQTVERLGFGRYEIEVLSDIEGLDPHVVFGFFHYPTEDVGPDATHEIDIEFSRWGDSNNRPLNYTVWPARSGIRHTSRSYRFPSPSGAGLHLYEWRPSSIHFKSIALNSDGSHGRTVEWWFKPRPAAARISRKPMPLHINLWGFRGKPPSDGAPVEIIIKRLTFTPF